MVYAVFENVRYIAFDINGTLIGGQYHPWKWVFELGLGLKRRKNSFPLSWFEVQTGQKSFEEMVSNFYFVDDLTTLKKEAFKVYMNDLTLRKGCLELLETLRHKYELVVCSDTSGVTKVIAEFFNLEKYFSRFFYSIDMGLVKSDRKFWTTFLSSFSGIKSNEFIMVGDNPRCDIHWPNVLGMGTIQIETTELLSSLEIIDEYDKPSFYVTNLDQIKNLIM